MSPRTWGAGRGLPAREPLTNYLRHGVWGNRVRLDASTICQLACPVCPTGRGEIARGAVGSHFLRAADFERLLQRNPWIRKVELSNWGEIFLNPELPEILRRGQERGVRLTARNGANLNSASPEALEAVVRHQLEFLSVSLDGATPETYARYRVHGDLDRVLGHVRQLIRLKEQYRSPLPRLQWQYIIFGHNEHEIGAARRLAASLGMDFRLRLNWDRTHGFSPVRDWDTVMRELGAAGLTRETFERKYALEMVPCVQLWLNPQINADGRLLGCCVNIWGDYGDVFTGGLTRLLRSERYRYAKGMVLGLRESRPDIPCASCHEYQAIRTSRRPWAHMLRRLARWAAGRSLRRPLRPYFR